MILQDNQITGWKIWTSVASFCMGHFELFDVYQANFANYIIIPSENPPYWGIQDQSPAQREDVVFDFTLNQQRYSRKKAQNTQKIIYIL